MTQWDYALMLIFSLLMLSFFVYMFWRDLAVRPKERPAETHTVLRCGDGAERLRKFQEGDYVGKPTNECEGGVIIGIFKEAPQQG